MDKRIIIAIQFLIFSTVFAYNPEDRTAQSMIQAKKYHDQKNWPGIVKIARKFYTWGEYPYVEKCLLMAEPIVAGRNSYSGALQLSDLYGKINNEKKQDYWMKVYQRIMEERKRKWKKN